MHFWCDATCQPGWEPRSSSMVRQPACPGRVVAVLGPTNTGKTHFAVERMLAHRSGHDRLPASPARPRDLRPDRGHQGPRRLRPDHRRGEGRRGGRGLSRLHGRGDADAARGGVPRRRRDPARRRPRARPRLHRPAAARPRQRGDHVPGLGHDPPDPAAAGARGRGDQPAALLDPLLRRRQQAAPPAAPQRGGRVLGRRGLQRWPRSSGARRAGRRWCWAPSRRARATPRSRCTRPARSSIWSPPTRSAWASTWTSPTSPSPSSPSSTAREHRRLRAPEMAQIAGRAGRHMANGTFGATNGCEPFEPREIEAIEGHSLRAAQGPALAQQRARLRRRRGAVRQPRPGAGAGLPGQGPRRDRPPQPDLPVAARRDPARPPPARSGCACCGRSARSRTSARPSPTRTCICWPRSIRHLTGRRGVLPNDWVGDMIAQLERFDGDIDALVSPDRPCPHLDLHVAPRELADGRRALAGAGARGRGPAVRRAARAADPALRRPADLRADALAARPRRARGRGRHDRRDRGRRPSGRPDRGAEPHHRRGRAGRRSAAARRPPPGGRRCRSCAAGRPSWSPRPTTRVDAGRRRQLVLAGCGRWPGCAGCDRAGAPAASSSWIRRSTPRRRTGSGAGWAAGSTAGSTGVWAPWRACARRRAATASTGAGAGHRLPPGRAAGRHAARRGRQPDPRTWRQADRRGAGTARGPVRPASCLRAGTAQAGRERGARAAAAHLPRPTASLPPPGRTVLRPPFPARERPCCRWGSRCSTALPSGSTSWSGSLPRSGPGRATAATFERAAHAWRRRPGFTRGELGALVEALGFRPAPAEAGVVGLHAGRPPARRRQRRSAAPADARARLDSPFAVLAGLRLAPRA